MDVGLLLVVGLFGVALLILGYLLGRVKEGRKKEKDWPTPYPRDASGDE